MGTMTSISAESAASLSYVNLKIWVRHLLRKVSVANGLIASEK